MIQFVVLEQFRSSCKLSPTVFASPHAAAHWKKKERGFTGPVNNVGLIKQYIQKVLNGKASPLKRH